MVKQSDKRLFDDLEAWSRRKDSFSINDFLRENKLSFNDFERLANSNRKFMKIWGEAESQSWENVKNALFNKSQPKSKITKYIEEREVFQDSDPEEVIQSLERCKAKIDLYQKAMNGDFAAIMQCSLERGMITQDQYEEAMAIPNEDD